MTVLMAASLLFSLVSSAFAIRAVLLLRRVMILRSGKTTRTMC
jgi:hypothetical protein